MVLKYPYKQFLVSRAVVSLGGRLSRPKPILTVSVVGPLGTRAVEGLLDTGADDTVFNDSVAADIRVNLSAAAVATGAGVGGTVISIRYAEVTLRLATGTATCEWRAWVGFTPVRLHRALFGFAGFLQFFTAAFYGDREEVELTSDALLLPP
jgi:hypothetical protein